MKHIVIIGNGISGITCARHVRKRSDDRITVISAETQHFFARTALMYIYMGHMKYEHTKPYEDFFWGKNKIDLINKQVTKINCEGKELVFDSGEKISYDTLVIACGSRSNIPDIHGKDLKGIHTLYSYSDLQKIEAGTKNITHAVISGGGLIGIEMAEMLISRNIHVTMMVREPTYWGSVLSEEEGKLIGRHINEHKIELLLNTEMSEIIGDEHGNVKAVKTKDGQIIACQFAGITIGVSPNVAFLKDSGIELDKGVLVNEYFETNVDGVYAIGDCAQFKEALPGRKPLEQIWYTGRMHGETLAQTLIGKRTPYRPGPAFNSAKFLDIEYQTYGATPVKKEDNIKTFYW
jgi:NAD(P)H-nitrite reductase large subunit